MGGKIFLITLNWGRILMEMGLIIYDIRQLFQALLDWQITSWDPLVRSVKDSKSFLNMNTFWCKHCTYVCLFFLELQTIYKIWFRKYIYDNWQSIKMNSAQNKYFASTGHRVRQSPLCASHSQFVLVFCIWYTIEIWKPAGHCDRQNANPVGHT